MKLSRKALLPLITLIVGLAIGLLLWALGLVLLFVLTMTLCANRALGQDFTGPRVPATAAALGIIDRAERSKRLDATYLYYLWSPSGSDADYYTASVACNVALNLSSCQYIPERAAGGALIVVDLAQLAETPEQLERLTKLMLVLSAREPYFNYTKTKVVVDAKTKKETTATVTEPAPHLGDAVAIGAGRMFRVDWFAANVLSAAEDGLYYEFRGLVPFDPADPKKEVTTLEGYLKSRGASLEVAEKLNAVDQGIQLSDVTGSVRVWALWHGQGTKPSVGTPLASITKDIQYRRRNFITAFDDVLTENFEAFECIIRLPNGQQEFTIFDRQKRLIRVAAANVVTDNQVRQPVPAELYAAIGCIRCHGPQSGYQSLKNGLRSQIDNYARFHGDVGKGKTKTDRARLIQSRFGAEQRDIDRAIFSGREGLNRLYDRLTPKEGEPASCKAAYAATAASYDYYAHSWVTPTMACNECGLEVENGNPVATLKAAFPPPDPLGRVIEGSAGVLNRLEDGQAVERQEFDRVYVELQMKAMISIQRKIQEQRQQVEINKQSSIKLNNREFRFLPADLLTVQRMR